MERRSRIGDMLRRETGGLGAVGRREGLPAACAVAQVTLGSAGRAVLQVTDKVRSSTLSSVQI